MSASASGLSQGQEGQQGVDGGKWMSDEDNGEGGKWNAEGRKDGMGNERRND